MWGAELHGREDGRTRSLVFVQMGILVLLAVFTAEATDGSGRWFALVYAIFLSVSGVGAPAASAIRSELSVMPTIGCRRVHP